MTQRVRRRDDANLYPNLYMDARRVCPYQRLPRSLFGLKTPRSRAVGGDKCVTSIDPDKSFVPCTCSKALRTKPLFRSCQAKRPWGMPRLQLFAQKIPIDMHIKMEKGTMILDHVTNIFWPTNSPNSVAKKIWEVTSVLSTTRILFAFVDTIKHQFAVTLAV